MSDGGAVEQARSGLCHARRFKVLASCPQLRARGFVDCLLQAQSSHVLWLAQASTHPRPSPVVGLGTKLTIQCHCHCHCS